MQYTSRVFTWQVMVFATCRNPTSYIGNWINKNEPAPTFAVKQGWMMRLNRNPTLDSLY